MTPKNPRCRGLYFLTERQTMAAGNILQKNEMRTKIVKSHYCRQYICAGNHLAVCVTSASRIREGVPKETSATLFYGGAWGGISRKLAADILRQMRRDANQISSKHQQHNTTQKPTATP
jgi:hypothetical protein